MRMTITLRAVRSILILTLAASAALTAAQTSSQPQASSSQTSQTSSSQDQNVTDTFKVDVGVVNILFNVKDKHGMLIPGLRKQDFEISEDGKPQTIKYFTAESNLPLT